MLNRSLALLIPAILMPAALAESALEDSRRASQEHDFDRLMPRPVRIPRFGPGRPDHPGLTAPTTFRHGASGTRQRQRRRDERRTGRRAR